MIPEGALSFELWGVAGLVLLWALMEGVKKLWPGLADRRTILVSMGLALILSTIAELYQIGRGLAVDPPLIEVLDTIGAGIITGLAAGGFFSFTKSRPTDA